MTSRRNAGLTLIETLIVFLVIAIIVMIAYGVIGRLRQRSKVLTCVSQLKQLATALSSYSADNDDLVPPWPTQSTYVPESKIRPRPKILVGEPEKWRKSLMERGANEEAFWCPLDPHRNTDFVAEYDGKDDHRERFTSYQTNYALHHEKLVDGKGHIFARPSLVKNGSELPYLIEHCWDPDGDPEHPKLITPHGDLGYALYFDFHVDLSPGSKIVLGKAR